MTLYYSSYLILYGDPCEMKIVLDERSEDRKNKTSTGKAIPNETLSPYAITISMALNDLSLRMSLPTMVLKALCLKEEKKEEEHFPENEKINVVPKQKFHEDGLTHENENDVKDGESEKEQLQQSNTQNEEVLISKQSKEEEKETVTKNDTEVVDKKNFNEQTKEKCPKKV